MASWVPAPKADDLGLIPGTHMMEGENSLLQVALDIHMCMVAHMHPHDTHAHTVKSKIKMSWMLIS